jgi:ABC-type transporter MlaC component
MTDTRPPVARAPWITAAALGAVAIALAGVVLFVIRPDRNRHEAAAHAVGLPATAQQAMDAASKQVLNMLTYSRKSFAADYARAVDGATGALKADLQSSAKKSTLQNKMTSSKLDLQGAVTATAFEEVSGTNWLILVSAQGYQVPDGGKRTLASRERFQVTMTNVAGKWLASDLQSVGLI